MYQLRDYQKKAVENTIQYFKKKRDPALIVLPTGAGKSLVIAELARIAQGRVLVLAHVKELVEQNHAKFESYGIKAGVYSAGLNKKQTQDKVIFGSIQSVANAQDSFFEGFTLLVIDECHRVNIDDDTQYGKVIQKLKSKNSTLCVLGLTATPYRTDLGWLYNYTSDGETKTTEPRFFQHCIFELPLQYMIKNRFLTPPVKINIPVTCYDFSELAQPGKTYTVKEVDELLTQQRSLTPLIIKNIIDIAQKYERQGVMIFSSTVKHARDILSYLPNNEAKLILGETDDQERDQVIEDFKQKKFKYLVNVSVLTTGFDAPHVDVIAILRPTESVSLYQQIVGRGLRLDDNKKDCFILDYTGMSYDIYSPSISEKKTTSDSVPVLVECPKCSFENTFWGLQDDEGNVIEHYGRKCKGGEFDEETYAIKPCNYRFRFKTCEKCGEQNDLTARSCAACKHELVSAEEKLKQAKLSKKAHVLIPDHIEWLQKKDKNNNAFLQIKYYDFDANALSEYYYLNNSSSIQKFNINFLRSHMKKPELKLNINSVESVIESQRHFRLPAFIIARKQDKFWKITEKIFAEEVSPRIGY